MSRALLWLVLPLATVMFPKIVHSAARSEKSNLLALVLVGTAVLAAGGALGLTLLGPWIVRVCLHARPTCGRPRQVLPWYAWAMVPLSLANALVNNLLARSQFRIVPVLLLLAVAYGVALTHFHGSLILVLKTLGVFNLLLLAACAWFTWQGGAAKRMRREDRGRRIDDRDADQAGKSVTVFPTSFSILYSRFSAGGRGNGGGWRNFLYTQPSSGRNGFNQR